jgi:hypothetical protein
MSALAPVIGEWYQQPGGTLLEVVAIDRDDGTIEVQHFDGTLEEFDADAWYDQEFVAADAPEDWTGSVDIEPEDVDQQADSASQTQWAGALDYLDRNEADGYSEWPRLPEDRSH